MAEVTLDVVLVELRALRRLVERLQRDTLTPAQRAVVVAAARLYGPAAAFSACTLADAARFDPEARAGLQRACDGNVQRIGIVLGQVADSGAVVDNLRLVRLPPEAGSRRWTLEVVESL